MVIPNQATTPSGANPRRLPPVAEMCIVTMILVVICGIYMAAYLPRPVPIAIPIVLLAAASSLLVTNLAALSRLREFAWGSFFLVAKWALLAYLVIAGMLEYVFVLDHTPARPLALLSVSLAIFAIDVPLLFAFSVARYQLDQSKRNSELGESSN